MSRVQVRSVIPAGAVAVLIALSACGSTAESSTNSTNSLANTSNSTVAGSPSTQTADPNQPTATTDPDPPAVAVPTSGPNPPPPDPNVVGPPADPSSSALLSTVVSAWTSMSWTLYSHRDTENAATGHYQFDCVGATNYFLSLADPNANNALRTAEHIGKGYVPSPQAVSNFFMSLPATGTSTWTPIVQMSQVQGGDVIVVPPAPGSTEPGHALMTAGPPLALSNGDYALLVYDSTGMPAHGPDDTRTWDTRDQYLEPGNRRSGLGRGTVEISVTSAGVPDHLFWSVGGSEYGGVINIAQPLS